MLNEIVIVGDSIAVGVGASAGKFKWTSLLCASKACYENNVAISSSHMIKGAVEPTTSWQDRFNLIPTKTTNRKYLIIALGVNDVGFNYTDFTLAIFITHYTALVNNAVSKGWSSSNIVLLNISYVNTPTVWDSYLSYGIPSAADTARYEAFRGAITTDLASLGIVLDPYPAMATYGIGCLNGDGLHPNDIGHSIIANELINSLTINNMTINKTPNSRRLLRNSYDYESSTEGDAIGDTRKGTINGWFQEETCTGAHATRGSGTWIVTEAKKTISLTDSNMGEAAGSYVDLPTGKSGIGCVKLGVERTWFDFATDGSVTLINNSANVSTASEDAKLIVRDAGTNVRIVNELGSTLIATITINYNA